MFDETDCQEILLDQDSKEPSLLQFPTSADYKSLNDKFTAYIDEEIKVDEASDEFKRHLYK